MSGTDRVRIATWNVLALPGDDGGRAVRIGEYLAHAGVDVALLQEVAVSQGVDTAGLIAKSAGMEVVATGLRTWWENDAESVTGPAILVRSDRMRLLEAEPVGLQRAPQGASWEFESYPSATMQSPSGRIWLTTSVHLPWGGEQEPRRLAHAQLLDCALGDRSWRWQENMGHPPVVVLGGDFNTLPESDTLRWLTGLGANGARGAYWVDAWGARGDGSPGFTQDPSSGNRFITHSAHATGIADPELLPARRIDFLLTRGWAHGRPGCPLTVELLGAEPDEALGYHLSDHLGVVADLWDPPLQD